MIRDGDNQCPQVVAVSRFKNDERAFVDPGTKSHGIVFVIEQAPDRMVGSRYSKGRMRERIHERRKCVLAIDDRDELVLGVFVHDISRGQMVALGRDEVCAGKCDCLFRP